MKTYLMTNDVMNQLLPHLEGTIFRRQNEDKTGWYIKFASKKFEKIIVPQIKPLLKEV